MIAMTERRPYSLAQLTLYFLKLGSIGFGGPVALVGYMYRDLVENRHWIGDEDYKEGLTLAQLMPGPLAAQLAMYLGYVHYRIAGATVAGIAFVLPSFLMVVAIGWAYVRYGGLPGMQAAFYGVGAAVFGSGLAIVPFLYGGVVHDHQWLNERQFVDAVAVAMITPGPVVITVGFIGYLIAGLAGAVVAALGTFLPCYLFTVLPAPYFKKYGKRPDLLAFVAGVTAAAIGAITGAVIVLAERSIVDWLTGLMALVTIGLLWKVKKLPEPALVAIAAIIGLVAFPGMRQ